jgi:hypothetical protein
MTSNQPWWLTMPPVELAAVILPWFSSHGTLLEERVMTSVTGWLKTGSDREARSHIENDTAAFRDPDVRAVAEAIQVLEHASLLMRAAGNVGLTRLGMHALGTNTLRQHLGLSGVGPNPPPA